MIHVEDVSVVRLGRPVLEGVRLTAASGERLAIVGASGSGKSTLLLALAGGVEPKAGAVRFDDAAKVGYVPALLAGWPVVRSDEFLEYCAGSLGLSGKAMRVAVSRGLSMAGLADVPSMRLDALSDGAKKRLLLARALLDDPDVLLLDDPFASLDPDGREMVERLVEDVGLAGGIVVGALNDGIVGRCWTRAITLADGRVQDDRRIG